MGKCQTVSTIIIVIIIIFLLFILSSSQIITKLIIKETFKSCTPQKHYTSTFPWNYYGFKQNNNCYSYALNEPDITLWHKRYPGSSSHTKRDFNIYTCKYFEHLLKKDYPNIKKTDNYKKCPCDKNYHMIAMVIADGYTPYKRDEDDDFHFYRLDKNNKWSHKQGSKKISYKDANNDEIIDPKKANHYYKQNNMGSKNYNKFCGYYCI
jgi:hypothetical protein